MTREYLKECDELSLAAVRKFFSSERQFYCTVMSTVIEKFPFKNIVLQAISYLNPKARDKIIPEDFANLSDIFMLVLPEPKASQVRDCILTLKADLHKTDNQHTNLTKFWNSMKKLELPGGKMQYDLHQKSKVMLTLRRHFLS
ncbi:uncharacterized protein LOC143252040 [Tachypleus tridentatus]|uniref:uncharacterized protein LOC143252040 n=1 Tax=Tachypleus tridentatus TaxID=6853 RepID=UPI003FD234DD